MTGLLAARCGFFTQFPNSSEESKTMVKIDETHCNRGQNILKAAVEFCWNGLCQQSVLVKKMMKLLTKCWKGYFDSVVSQDTV